jgi:transposase
VRSRKARAEDVRRARLVLMLADGASYSAVCQALGVHPPYVQRWKSRFEVHGLTGLGSLYRGRKATVLTPKLEARILTKTLKSPPAGATHWSTRTLAKALGVTHMTVARVWRRHGLKPHRLERYLISDDPLFEEKAADILGLYLRPPAHAAVFCVDEKSAIQALDRLDPVLPLSPGRAERHGFEYYRHGTLSLFAALNTKNGEVLGRTAPRHTSAAFVEFLSDIVASQPRGKEIHVILDNLSTHKTRLVQDFLLHHPRVSLHYTPTYSSWLNQVELWFAKIERDVIARGVFSSVPDLRRKLMGYIRRYNDEPRPIRWVYSDPTHRITPATISRVTVH